MTGCPAPVPVGMLGERVSVYGVTVIWDDEPGGYVEHVADHGLTPDDVDAVLFGPGEPTRSSSPPHRPCKFGWTPTGRHIVVVWDEIDADTI